jgi:hypothetical protein
MAANGDLVSDACLFTKIFLKIDVEFEGICELFYANGYLYGLDGADIRPALMNLIEVKM